ncbi:LysR family transcriptional regulator [Bordetella petrii]|uniref:LysR family transcriptional regulator n=1 Tax=Bordetella petrii TaxID=94624 RepID=UPI0038B3AA57
MATRTPQWDLQRLSIFMSVASAGSLKGAANALGLPQSAISRQITRLESQCNGRLFSRTGRGMVLTELGERLMPQIDRLLDQADELSGVVAESAAQPFGEVTVGALPSLYLSAIVPLFFALRDQHPGIKLRILEGSGGQIDQWLGNGEVDIGLPYRYGPSAANDADLLFDLASYLVGRPGAPLLGRDHIAFADLDGVPLVLPGRPSAVRLLLDQIARRAGISINVVFEADSTQLQKALAAGGGGYTVLPMHVVRDEIAAGKMQAVRIVEPQLRRGLVLAVTRARPASLAVRSVVALLRQHFGSERVMRKFLD